jgi:hypothetical protein
MVIDKDWVNGDMDWGETPTERGIKKLISF